MDESESKNEKMKEGRRFSQEQYDMLKRCSDKKDMTEWNEWREENEDKEILLEGANLNKRYLKRINLKYARMKGACLKFSHLEEANLWSAHLEGAVLLGAHLQGAKIKRAYLQGADFMEAEVDVHTVIRDCEVDRETDFRIVALDSVRIDPGTKQLLEYNIRRMNWEDWYPKHTFLRWPVSWFWSVSNYGLSTWRIIGWFFGLAVVFAGIYRLLPSCVMVNGVVGDIRGFVHALYFSVVTMTTLGFGDIAANPDSWGGQTLLMLQVILGYVLLGALVTRFAVLFTAGGPAGKFANEKKKRNKTTEKIKN